MHLPLQGQGLGYLQPLLTLPLRRDLRGWRIRRKPRGAGGRARSCQSRYRGYRGQLARMRERPAIERACVRGRADGMGRERLTRRARDESEEAKGLPGGG